MQRCEEGGEIRNDSEETTSQNSLMGREQRERERERERRNEKKGREKTSRRK